MLLLEQAKEAKSNKEQASRPAMLLLEKLK